jgi:predicted RecA/RadA family phage recombinase
MAEATYLRDSDVVRITAPAALTNGEVIQLANGHAGVVGNAGAGVASGDEAAIQAKGVFMVAKTTSVVILDGQRLYWVESTGKCNFTGDFYLGVAVGDATAAATEIAVDLNVEMVPLLDLSRDQVALTETLGGFDEGLGLENEGGWWRAMNDNTSEASTHAIITKASFALGKGAIFEGWINVIALNAAATDLSFGVADGVEATDFTAGAEFVSIHLDGNDTDVQIGSDDGTTDTAEADAAHNYALGTPFFVQIDMRDESDVQVYIDGVLQLAASDFALDDATGPLFPIFHVEKTTSTDLWDVRFQAWIRTLARV